MPTIEPLSEDLIKRALEGRRILTDNSGLFMVQYGFDPDTGRQLTAYVMAEGDEKSILLIRIESDRTFSRAEWPKMLHLVNEFNRAYRWPKVYVNIAKVEAEVAAVYGEFQLPCATGVSAELLTECYVAALQGMTRFWAVAHADHGI